MGRFPPWHMYGSPALQNNFARNRDPICSAGSWNNEPLDNGVYCVCTTFPCEEVGPTQTPCKPHFSSCFTFETTLRGDPSLDAPSPGPLCSSSEKKEFGAPQDLLVQNARTRASHVGAENGQKGVSKEPLALPALPEVVPFAFPYSPAFYWSFFSRHSSQCCGLRIQLSKTHIIHTT